MESRKSKSRPFSDSHQYGELHRLDAQPTASLDPDVALKVRTGLNRLCAEDGAALLVTSHNMVEVERLCDRVVFISQGKIVADGRPGDVAARFGRADLEGVFLHLAEERQERVPEQRRRRGA